MYSTRSGLILGFHGCDISVANEVATNTKNLRESDNSYDWLGHGIYFWENSPDRAYEFATFLKNNPSKAKTPIKTPAVIDREHRIVYEVHPYEIIVLSLKGHY